MGLSRSPITHKMINTTYLKTITDGTLSLGCCLTNLHFNRLDILKIQDNNISTYLISLADAKTIHNNFHTI